MIGSAGVGAVVGHGFDARAVTELTRLGGSGEDFAARQIDRDHIANADLVLTATADIRTRVLREDPRALKRTFILGEFAAICAATDATLVTPAELVAFGAANRGLGSGELDVLDPIGQDGAVHRAVADQIDGYVRTIAARLGPLLDASSAP